MKFAIGQISLLRRESRGVNFLMFLSQSGEFNEVGSQRIGTCSPRENCADSDILILRERGIGKLGMFLDLPGTSCKEGRSAPEEVLRGGMDVCAIDP